jgi:aryl-alcohol dehydrogenase-like predicted oxidoreductase
LIALNDLIKEGKVRYIGLSNETPYGIMKFSQVAKDLNLQNFISLQNCYSLIVRSDFETNLKEVCSPRNKNIGLLAYSPLAGGVLSGKYLLPEVSNTSRLNLFEGYMARYRQSLAHEAVNEYCNIAKKYDLTPTELSLAWCYKQEHVTSTIIGATSMKQLKENIDAFDKQRLITDDVINYVNNIYFRYKDPSKSST